MSDLWIDILTKVTLVLLLASALYFALRRAAAATRHLVLSLARLGLVALPVAALALPSWRLEVLPPVPGQPAELSPAPVVLAADHGAERSFSPAVRPGVQRSPASPRPPAVSPSFRFPVSDLGDLLVWLWGLGAVFSLLSVGFGLVRLQGIVRRSEPLTDLSLLRQLDDCREPLDLRSRPKVALSAETEIPFLCGIFHPILIVPRSFVTWEKNRTRAVYLHELGHLRRADWPSVLLGRLVSALYWFHPLVWYLEQRAREECERACDDLVVRCGMKPSEYAAHLLSIATHLRKASSPRAALAFAERSPIGSRVRSILDPRSRRRGPSRRAAASSFGVLVALLIPLATLQLAPQSFASEREKTAAAPADDDARGWFKFAYTLHSKGRYEEAIPAFEHAAELGFRRGTSLYNAACGYAQQGDVAMALDRLEQSWEAGFDDLDLLVRDTDLHPLRADASFQDFVDRAFEDAGVRRSSRKHRPYERALELLEKLRDESSTEGRAWYKVGTRLLYMRELDLAIEALGEAVHHLGDDGETAMYNLACAHSLAGDRDAAFEWLDRAIEAGFDASERFENDPDLAPLRDRPRFEALSTKNDRLRLNRFRRGHHKGSPYSERGWDEAIDHFRAYLSEDEKSGRAWFNLGFALHYSRRHAEAVEAFEKALENGYQEATATYNIACAYAQQGYVEDALDWLERAAEAGFHSVSHIEKDEDLESLRSDSRFRDLLDRLEREHEDRHRIYVRRDVRWHSDGDEDSDEDDDEDSDDDDDE